MTWHSIEPRTKNMLKDMDFYHFRENIESDYWIQENML